MRYKARKSGVKLVTRLSSAFVVERFGKECGKEDILRDIKPIKRVINGKNAPIYQFKRFIVEKTTEICRFDCGGVKRGLLI